MFLFAAPGVASADVIFDPADADELAATLAEATDDQGVCYGWKVNVDNVGVPETSTGSNQGAGTTIDGSCAKYVELTAQITYTSESSESEDSASYDLSSSPGGPTRADLDALDLDWDGLTGEDPDVVIGKAVTALPLLAADKGMAKPIEAAPETGAAPADAQLTDDPGSDWWRESGGAVLWGVGLLLAGGLFAWWVLKTNRVRRRPRPEPVPEYVPEDFYEPADEPKPEPTPEPETAPEQASKPDTAPELETAAEPETAPEPEAAPESEAAPVEPEPPAEATPAPEPSTPPEKSTKDAPASDAPSEPDASSDLKDKE
jgi:outer membrane biosynthesis protein TonB